MQRSYSCSLLFFFFGLITFSVKGNVNNEVIKVASFLDHSKDLFTRMSLEGSFGKTQMVPLEDGKFVEFEEFKCYDGNDVEAVPKDFVKEMDALPKFQVADGVFANNPQIFIEKDEKNVVNVGKNVFIHENLLSEEEAEAILQQSKSWTYDYERKDQFHVAHINISTLLLDANKPSLKERLTTVLGASHVFLPDVIPIKRISTHEKLPNHMDNAGFTDATVILYFQNLKSGGLAFPARELAVLPKVGRAVMFFTRTTNNTIDYDAIHHTMKFDKEEDKQFGDFRLSVAIAVKILGGLNSEWYSSPHQVAFKRPAGFCHGIGVYNVFCNEGQGCAPNECTANVSVQYGAGCILGPYGFNPSATGYCNTDTNCSICKQAVVSNTTTLCQSSNKTVSGYTVRNGESENDCVLTFLLVSVRAVQV